MKRLNTLKRSDTMRRDSLRKPMSSRDDGPRGSEQSLMTLPRTPSRVQDEGYMRQLTIDTLVQQGQELVWKRQLKDAIAPLERSLNILRGIEVLQMPPLESQPGSIISRRSSVSSLVDHDDEDEKPPCKIDAGPTIQMLCLVFSRAGDWQKVYDLTELALSSEGADPVLDIFGQDILLDVKLSRAVALTHLAGPTDSEPHRLPIFEQLDQADKLLMEVEKSRPKDNAVRRGLQHVAFLKKQSRLAVPQPEPITGLARLRAMDA